MEIERKWKIKGFPQGLPLLREAHMRQGYLSVSPVVRIRESSGTDGSSFILCFKGPGTLARQEIELPLEEPVFRQLEDLIGRPLVTKEFKVYRLPGGEHLEVSLVDKGLPTEFYYAEVEFSSVEEARAFLPPDGIGLGEDLTESPGFSMSRYWQQTRGADGRCPFCGAPLDSGVLQSAGMQLLWARRPQPGRVLQPRPDSGEFLFPHKALEPVVLPAPYCPVCCKVFLSRRQPDIGDSVPPLPPEGLWG